jgi:hypothetical protein
MPPSRVIAEADIGERRREQPDSDKEPEEILHHMFQSEAPRGGEPGPDARY